EGVGRGNGGRRTARARTVVASGFARDLTMRFIPQVPLGGLADSDYPEMGFLTPGAGSMDDRLGPLGESMPLLGDVMYERSLSGGSSGDGRSDILFDGGAG